MSQQDGTSNMGTEAGDGRFWYERRGNGKFVLWAVVAVCVALLALDITVHKHGPFSIEHVWGFYSLLAVAVSIVLIVAVKLLRGLMIRPEDYYDR